MEPLPLEITMDALAQLPEGSYQLADMRSEQGHERGNIPGAMALPASSLDVWQPEADVPVVLVCARGIYSQEAAQQLRDRGASASSLAGGYPAWLLFQLQQKEAAAVTAPGRGQPGEAVPAAAVEQIHPSHPNLRSAAAGGSGRRVHLRQEGLHAHGQAVSEAAPAQQIPL